MADPDRFCRDNLKTWGPIFRTGVFGDNHSTEVSLSPTTNAMFGENSFCCWGCRSMRGMQARRRLIVFTAGVIERRRGQPFPQVPQDFLGLMLHGQRADPEGLFTDALIANQCLLQLWGAHYEITGLLASWMVQIARHPEVRRRLDQELAASLSVPVEALTLEELRRLPPSSTATRRLTRPVEIHGMLPKKGWGLIAEPRLVHGWERLYPDPGRFDPERFLGGAAEDRRYAFIPFVGGVHACLGAQLAMTVTRVLPPSTCCGPSGGRGRGSPASISSRCGR